MNRYDKALNNFFASWENNENHRNLSWEHCYLFFLQNKESILNDDNMLDHASLHLAFYLASWGMYRGSSKLLQLDYKIYNELIKKLLKECSNLWGENVTWEEIQKADKIIVEYYKNCNLNPTATLKTKILMGIFACVPAFDRYVKSALKSENICKTYNKKSFEMLQKIAKEIKTRPMVSNCEYNYPQMKLVDYYFWNEGKGFNS